MNALDALHHAGKYAGESIEATLPRGSKLRAVVVVAMLVEDDNFVYPMTTGPENVDHLDPVARNAMAAALRDRATQFNGGPTV